MNAATLLAASRPGRPRTEHSPDLLERNRRIIDLDDLGVPVGTIAAIERVSERTVYRVLSGRCAAAERPATREE